MTSSTIDTKYKEAAQYIQTGSWKKATSLLQELLKEYPDHRTEIAPLLEHVQMKAKIEGQNRVRGRSPLEIALFNRKRWNRIGIVVLLGMVLWGGWLVFDRLIVPVQAQYAQDLRIEELMQDARDAVAQTAWQEAAGLYQAALTVAPDLEEAEQGLARAERQIRLAEEYSQALALLDQGKQDEALALLEQLQAEEPNYRDVVQRIANIKNMGDVASLFQQAEDHYHEQNWAQAIPLYVEIRQANQGYQASTVESHLRESYVYLANEFFYMAGLDIDDVGEIARLFNKALSLQPRDRESRLKERMLNQYMDSLILMDQGDYERAVHELQDLYQLDAELLGGDGVQGLYEARLAFGQRLQSEGNLWAALVQYTAAGDLPVADTGRAELLARTVSLLLKPTPTHTPEPTSTPTPVPTPTPNPVDEVKKLLPPTPSPIDQYMGWIAFKSDRPHAARNGLWVMSPDGSQQRTVSDPNGLYEHLQQQAKWKKDNTQRIWVEDDGSEKSVALYMWRYDLPIHWNDARVELLNNSAINYHPVLSPDDSAVAFTSQRSGSTAESEYGDEIFIFYFSEFNADGYVTPHRLTHNDWEWDKHPTFSPDGQTIAFWSNRDTGRAQIWAMNADGSNQRNLSNNEWNDWDPVYLIPPRELPADDPKAQETPGPVFDPAKFEANQ